MKVKVRCEKLLNVLRHNRKKHLEDYEQALSIWRDKLLYELQSKMSVMAVDSWKENNFNEITRIISQPPVKFVDEYDKAIRALEFVDKNTEIELTLEEVERYVNDSWHWKERFFASLATYQSN